MAVLIEVLNSYTAWKVSKYGVISGPYFPVFSPNTGKYGQEITPYLDTFHAVLGLLKFEVLNFRNSFLLLLSFRQILTNAVLYRILAAPIPPDCLHFNFDQNFLISLVENKCSQILQYYLEF